MWGEGHPSVVESKRRGRQSFDKIMWTIVAMFRANVMARGEVGIPLPKGRRHCARGRVLE